MGLQVFHGAPVAIHAVSIPLDATERRAWQGRQVSNLTERECAIAAKCTASVEGYLASRANRLEGKALFGASSPFPPAPKFEPTHKGPAAADPPDSKTRKPENGPRDSKPYQFRPDEANDDEADEDARNPLGLGKLPGVRFPDGHRVSGKSKS